MELKYSHLPEVFIYLVNGVKQFKLWFSHIIKFSVSRQFFYKDYYKSRYYVFNKMFNIPFHDDLELNYNSVLKEFNYDTDQSFKDQLIYRIKNYLKYYIIFYDLKLFPGDTIQMATINIIPCLNFNPVYKEVLIYNNNREQQNIVIRNIIKCTLFFGKPVKPLLEKKFFFSINQVFKSPKEYPQPPSACDIQIQHCRISISTKNQNFKMSKSDKGNSQQKSNPASTDLHPITSNSKHKPPNHRVASSEHDGMVLSDLLTSVDHKYLINTEILENLNSKTSSVAINSMNG